MKQKTERKTYEVVRGITLSTKFILSNGEAVRVKMQGHNGSKRKVPGTYTTSDPRLIEAMDKANGNAKNGGREFKEKVAVNIPVEDVVTVDSFQEKNPVDPNVVQPKAAVAPVVAATPESLRTPEITPNPVPVQQAPAPVPEVVKPEPVKEEITEGSPADEVPDSTPETEDAQEEGPAAAPAQEEAATATFSDDLPPATKIPDITTVQAAKTYLVANHGQKLSALPNKAAVLEVSKGLGVSFPNLPE